MRIPVSRRSGEFPPVVWQSIDIVLRFKATQDIWNREFAYCGVGDKAVLFRDSAAQYIFYASGRRHLQSAYCLLEVFALFIVSVGCINPHSLIAF
jgi:hypothetical protein